MGKDPKDHLRQRAFVDRHYYPPPPPWIDLAAWKLLFWGRGARTFHETWYRPPREEAMRVLAARGICCGLSEEGCLALVQAWLAFHALPTGVALAFEHGFGRQYGIAEGYLERRGVPQRVEQKQQEALRRRLERITRKTSVRLLLLVADNPGIKRRALQRELGLEAENIKDHIERLLEKDYLARVGYGRYAATGKAEALLSRLELAWRELAA